MAFWKLPYFRKSESFLFLSALLPFAGEDESVQWGGGRRERKTMGKKQGGRKQEKKEKRKRGKRKEVGGG